ncbi:MAG: LysR family transcriptional regulator [Eubacterium sp.]|nr:LysR family transcriptional regulator [Eubacterium sp.]
MELRQIQYIMQLFRDSNITRASRKLFISQQGLSKSINRMEDELGFPLFERSSSGVIPTEAALSLYHYFDKVASSYHDLEMAIEDLRQKHQLKLVGYQGFAMSCGRDIYTSYCRQYPESRVQYEEEYNDMIPDHIQNHKADLAFMFGPVPRILHSHQLIRKEPLCAVINRDHPLALKSRLSITDLHGQQILLLDQFQGFNDQVLKAADASNISYTLYGSCGISEFLPVVHTFNLIGFSTRQMYQNYNFPEVVFLPLKQDTHSDYQIETHLVSLRDLAPGQEAQQYIDYVASITE